MITSPSPTNKTKHQSKTKPTFSRQSATLCCVNPPASAGGGLINWLMLNY
jgi:hypothetical protein